MNNKKGFALVEVIIIVAVFSILAGILVPLAFKSSEAKKVSDVKKELKKIYYACVGDMEKEFGYLGDMGKLPDNLTELYIKNSQPNPTENPAGSGIYAGWKGPYITLKNVDANGIRDPYGNYYMQFYLQLNNNSACTNTDTKCRWFLMSEGADGAYNSSDPLNTSLNENKDNIYFPGRPLIVDRVGNLNTIYSTVTFKTIIAREQAAPSKNVKFIVYYPNNGSPAQLTSDFYNPATFTIPVGNRYVESYIINDNGNTFLPSIGKSIIWTQDVNKLKYLSFNAPLEQLNIINLSLQSQQICDPSTCVSPCSFYCCSGSHKKCKPAHSHWMLMCISSGCYDKCCSGSGGSGCTLDVSADSNINVNGTMPRFDLFLEGYDQSGVKILGPVNMQKSGSSPFFTYNNTSASCDIKTIRIYSSGGGGNITKNL